MFPDELTRLNEGLVKLTQSRPTTFNKGQTQTDKIDDFWANITDVIDRRVENIDMYNASARNNLIDSSLKDLGNFLDCFSPNDQQHLHSKFLNSSVTKALFDIYMEFPEVGSAIREVDPNKFKLEDEKGVNKFTSAVIDNVIKNLQVEIKINNLGLENAQNVKDIEGGEKILDELQTEEGSLFKDINKLRKLLEQAEALGINIPNKATILEDLEEQERKRNILARDIVAMNDREADAIARRLGAEHYANRYIEDIFKSRNDEIYSDVPEEIRAKRVEARRNFARSIFDDNGNIKEDVLKANESMERINIDKADEKDIAHVKDYFDKNPERVELTLKSKAAEREQEEAKQNAILEKHKAAIDPIREKYNRQIEEVYGGRNRSELTPEERRKITEISLLRDNEIDAITKADRDAHTKAKKSLEDNDPVAKIENPHAEKALRYNLARSIENPQDRPSLKPVQPSVSEQEAPSIQTQNASSTVNSDRRAWLTSEPVEVELNANNYESFISENLADAPSGSTFLVRAGEDAFYLFKHDDGESQYVYKSNANGEWEQIEPEVLTASIESSLADAIQIRGKKDVPDNFFDDDDIQPSQQQINNASLQSEQQPIQNNAAANNVNVTPSPQALAKMQNWLPDMLERVYDLDPDRRVEAIGQVYNSLSQEDKAALNQLHKNDVYQVFLEEVKVAAQKQQPQASVSQDIPQPVPEKPKTATPKDVNITNASELYNFMGETLPAAKNGESFKISYAGKSTNIKTRGEGASQVLLQENATDEWNTIDHQKLTENIEEGIGVKVVPEVKPQQTQQQVTSQAKNVPTNQAEQNASLGANLGEKQITPGNQPKSATEGKSNLANKQTVNEPINPRISDLENQIKQVQAELAKKNQGSKQSAAPAGKGGQENTEDKQESQKQTRKPSGLGNLLGGAVLFACAFGGPIGLIAGIILAFVVKMVVEKIEEKVMDHIDKKGGIIPALKDAFTSSKKVENDVSVASPTKGKSENQDVNKDTQKGKDGNAAINVSDVISPSALFTATGQAPKKPQASKDANTQQPQTLKSGNQVSDDDISPTALLMATGQAPKTPQTSRVTNTQQIQPAQPVKEDPNAKKAAETIGIIPSIPPKPQGQSKDNKKDSNVGTQTTQTQTQPNQPITNKDTSVASQQSQAEQNNIPSILTLNISELSFLTNTSQNKTNGANTQQSQNAAPSVKSVQDQAVDHARVIAENQNSKNSEKNESAKTSHQEKVKNKPGNGNGMGF